MLHPFGDDMLAEPTDGWDSLPRKNPRRWHAYPAGWSLSALMEQDEEVFNVDPDAQKLRWYVAISDVFWSINHQPINRYA